MKLNKLFLASMLAVSATSSALAATVNVYITGSTAFRAATNQAIADLVASNGQVGYVGSSLTGAGTVVATGTMTVNGVPNTTVAVYASWSGSEAGYQAVAANSQVAITNWINASAISGNAVGSVTSLTSPATFSNNANVCMADNAQSESNQHGTNFVNLTANQVGVVPFVWVKGTSNNTSVQSGLNNLTNMTVQQAQLVLTNQGTPLSVWTGNSADSASTIYPVGRDILSGTRLNTVLETYLATKGAVNFGISQYTVNPYVSGGIIQDFGSGAATADQSPMAQAAGYTSGGTMMGDVGKPVVSTKSFAIVGYAGTADAKSLPGVSFNTSTGVFSYTGSNTNPILSYNGVPYSYANVANGTYTLWGYEYLCFRGTLDTPSQKFCTQNLLSQIQADCQTTGAGLPLSAVSVSRAGAGQLVTP